MSFCSCTKCRVFFIELFNKNASALIVLKRLQRWICVLNHYGVLTIYFARVVFDIVIVHLGTMETGVNLQRCR